MIKLTLSFKGRILRVFHPSEGETRIGRDPDCEIQIDNLGLEPVHARIILDGEQARLEDCSADAGVRVNGEKAQQRELQHGDEILVGKHTLTVTQEADAPEEQPVPEAGMARALRSGWLQFLNGPKLGRTLRLEHNFVRLGKSGRQTAMIAVRQDGYYISHLEGEPPTRVGDHVIGDASHKLHDGDTIQIGDTKMLFFVKE